MRSPNGLSMDLQTNQKNQFTFNNKDPHQYIMQTGDPRSIWDMDNQAKS